MRYCVCIECGKRFSEDDNNPNIHYSPHIHHTCCRCEAYKKLEVGEWYQTSDGKYHQKE